MWPLMTDMTNDIAGPCASKVVLQNRWFLEAVIWYHVSGLTPVKHNSLGCTLSFMLNRLMMPITEVCVSWEWKIAWSLIGFKWLKVGVELSIYSTPGRRTDSRRQGPELDLPFWQTGSLTCQHVIHTILRWTLFGTCWLEKEEKKNEKKKKNQQKTNKQRKEKKTLGVKTDN